MKKLYRLICIFGFFSLISFLKMSAGYPEPELLPADENVQLAVEVKKYAEQIIDEEQRLRNKDKSLSEMDKANSFIQIAQSYSNSQNYPKANEFYSKALSLRGEVMNANSKYYLLEKIASNFEVYDKDSALFYYEEILNAKNIEDSSWVASIYMQSADLYIDYKSDADKAFSKYKEAFHIYSAMNDLNGVIQSYMKMARIYLIKNEYNNAIEYSSLALNIATETANNAGISEANTIIGISKYYLENYDESLNKLNKGLEWAKIDSVPGVPAEIYLYLSKVYKIKENYNKSRAYYKEFFVTKQHGAILHNDNKFFRLKSMQSLVSELAKRRNGLLKSEIKTANEKSQRILFIGAGSLAFFLLLFLIIVSRIRSKSKNALEEKSYEVKKLTKALNNLKYDIESSKNYNDELKNDIQNNKHKISELESVLDKLNSIISRDLQEPLKSVLLDSYVLLKNFRKMQHVQLEQNIDIIHRSTQKIVEFLENLILWEKLRNDRIEFNPDGCNLLEIAENAIKQFQAESEKKNIKIDLKIDKELSIFADKSLAGAIIEKLLSNSFKFSNKGIIRIGARKSNGNVSVTISDQGNGMDEETVSSLFCVNNNRRPTLDKSNNGSGLGLILSKRLIDLHGGEIHVKSAPGKGSEFKIQFPNANKLN